MAFEELWRLAGKCAIVTGSDRKGGGIGNGRAAAIRNAATSGEEPG